MRIGTATLPARILKREAGPFARLRRLCVGGGGGRHVTASQPHTRRRRLDLERAVERVHIPAQQFGANPCLLLRFRRLWPPRHRLGTVGPMSSDSAFRACAACGCCSLVASARSRQRQLRMSPAFEHAKAASAPSSCNWPRSIGHGLSPARPGLACRLVGTGPGHIQPEDHMPALPAGPGRRVTRPKWRVIHRLRRLRPGLGQDSES